jgi:hypothetical protein
MQAVRAINVLLGNNKSSKQTQVMQPLSAQPGNNEALA